MSGFFEKILSLAYRGEKRRRDVPFASAGATKNWLQELPASSDYDRHHALVEGLERYNGDTRGDALTRLKILMLLEETGLPLQAGIVAQYLESSDAHESGRQALWRECRLFWDQMAVAYLPFMGLALRGVDRVRLEPWRTGIAARSLHYLALNMRWESLRGQRPSESAWRRLHRIYRMAEIAGEVHGEIEIEGRKTSCAREYSMALLIDLANLPAFSLADARPVLEILDGLEALPIAETGLRRDRHSHLVDLAASSGAEKIEDRCVPGKRLRYLELRGVLSELERRAADARGTPHGALCRQLARVIGRSGANRGSPRKPRMGEVRAVFGAAAVMKVFKPYMGVVPNGEIISLRDESSEGAGFVLHDEPGLSPGGLLAVDRDHGHGTWQLLAARWSAEEGSNWLLGAEYLSKYPKLVDIEWEADTANNQMATAAALFLPVPGQSVNNNLLLPWAAYSHGRTLQLRQDDGTCYRLKLGEVIETHESWLRVGFDLLSREAAGTR